MKIAILLCSVAFAFAADNSWETFKVTHNKIYPSVQEEAYRRVIFQRNLKYIEEHNSLFAKGESTFTLGINKFADMTNEEFRAQMTGFDGIKRNKEKVFVSIAGEAGSDPDSIDWREKGAVTPVKDQGEMGASWAYSAVTPLESAWFIKNGKLIDMSEQQLNDCVTTDDIGDGWVQGCYEYIKRVGGIDGEDTYDKKASGCGFNPDGVVANLTGYVDIPQGNESSQAKAVYNAGPVSVLVDASHMSFQLYESGVYYEIKCSSEVLDHAMAVVGFGKEKNNEYWIVKNSWGTTWGEKGYIRMSRNRHNNCGIATNSCYPVV